MGLHQSTKLPGKAFHFSRGTKWNTMKHVDYQYFTFLA
ncbi:hypothetical protein MuYL_3569 [Mucilaginibacter xinganensis]|uniref:Uncharacterized protein n=1 Tax=Mucilaginibacter xinganensis TaxID=1234841 RepID=A0A223P0H4_9SPHI|nr:hypothetical protein MuYL_3569 [Mucilaginibacter xinganensis]